jgi:hypothetical protein
MNTPKTAQDTSAKNVVLYFSAEATTMPRSFELKKPMTGK